MSARHICLWISLILSILIGPALPGQTVNFNNNVLLGYVADGDGDVIVRTAGGTPLVGTNFVAQLYYGTTVADLVVHTGAPSRFRVPTTSSPGTWAGGNRTLTGLSIGSLAVLAVRVWDMDQAPTYEQALMWGTPAHDCGPFYYEVKPDGLSLSNYNMFEFRARNGLDACPSNQLPIILSQPQSQTVYRGDTLTLSANVMAGCLFQWRFNGQVVGYRPTLVISNAQPSHSGSYQLIADNYSGSVTSPFVGVTVQEPARVYFANDVNFQTPGERRVRWSEGSGLTGTDYVAQLYYGSNESNLRPLTNPPARFRSHSTSSPGTWSGGFRELPGFLPGMQVTLQVKVWDSREGATYEEAGRGFRLEHQPFLYTAPANLIPSPAFYMENFRSSMWLSCPGFLFFPPPIIHVHPTSQAVRAGSNVTLRVVSEYPCRNEWYFNGTLLPQSYSSTLTISNFQPANVGDYYARVSNIVFPTTNQFATSQVARITLIGQPRLTSIMQSGGFAVEVPANSGEQIIIETATNLSPGAIWIPLSTNTGPFWYTNSAAADRQRFYRTRTSPWF